MPDKAIDVIDEAGARVRLRVMTRPPDLKDIDADTEALNRKKEQAVADQDFEKAAKMRDLEREKRKKLEDIKSDWSKERDKITLTLGYEEMARVVSQWTKIPLIRLEKEESQKLLKMEDQIKTVVVGH